MTDAANLDFDIRIGGVIRRMEQLSGLSQVDEDLSLRQVTPRAVTAFRSNEFVEFANAAAGLFQPAMQVLEDLPVSLFERGEISDDRERRARIFLSLRDQLVTRLLTALR